MKFRLAVYEDLDQIMPIIKKAQKNMHAQEISQWINGYPGRDKIKDDIDKGYSYVLEDLNKIYVTGAVSFDVEITYDKIYEGEWLSHGDFVVIHRIAIDMDHKGSGMTSEFLDEVEKLTKEKEIYSIKIDTHRQNKAMQRFLKKHNFKYCGIIYLADGDERLAYEKILDK